MRSWVQHVLHNLNPILQLSCLLLHLKVRIKVKTKVCVVLEFNTFDLVSVGFALQLSKPLLPPSVSTCVGWVSLDLTLIGLYVGASPT